MKITLRLILVLVCVIGAAAGGFSLWQARQEESRLKNELDRRAAIIADSLRESIEPLLASRLEMSVKRIADKFSNRERLVGVSVSDPAGRIVAASTDLASDSEGLDRLIEQSRQELAVGVSGIGRFSDLNGIQVHVFALPLSEGGEGHLLTVFHDRSYITERVRRIWINGFWRALIQALMVSLATLVIITLSVMAPIKRATVWVKSVRRGDPPLGMDPKREVLLGPLAGEIFKLARNLESARKAAEEEARLRHSTESLWTPERLKEFVRVKLEGRSLFVVSNREPYMHIKKGKDIECIVPASGLVTALEPVLKACGGTWVAQGSGSGDRDTVDARDRLKVPPDEPAYTLRRVWVEPKEEEGFYNGFSNEGLWPLCHIAHTRPMFRAGDWEQYRAVNEKFADAVAQELEGTQEPFVLIQDYHFALLPAMVKARRPDARVAIFWHIPWPNPESFSICPWQKELVEGMLGADIVGFHTQFHCNNFMETVDRTMESRIDYEHFTVHKEGQATWIRPFPISIGFTEDKKVAGNGARPEAAELLKKHGVTAARIGVGVDRLDYTKGILERFRSVENFLENYPEQQGRFTFVELGAPSRTAVPRYAEFVAELEKEAERINERFKDKNWKPILFLKKHHSHADILPFYQAAELCLVTSLHDGMNLVAKEFVMARDDEKGALVLSQFTGASREFTDALIVNPYDVVQTAAAIERALAMPADEQRRRMRAMREVLRERNIYKWASDIVGELARIRVVRPL